MRANLGGVDRAVRVVIGIVLLAYAWPIGFPSTGWNQLGWLGLLPLVTGLAGYCPVYAVAEIDTCRQKPRR